MTPLERTAQPAPPVPTSQRPPAEPRKPFGATLAEWSAARQADILLYLGAFLLSIAALIFVGASWGANVPISKVMLVHFDLVPMSAIRTLVAALALGALLLAVEGTGALRIDLGLSRFALLGLMMGGFFACYTLGIQFSNPITAAMVGVAGPLVSAATGDVRAAVVMAGAALFTFTWLRGAGTTRRPTESSADPRPATIAYA